MKNDERWTVAKPGAGNVPATIPIVYNERGNAVAHVLAGDDAAHLIAAAPEMLEALKSEAEWLAQMLEYGTVPESTRAGFERRLDLACAAIARAEGES